MVPGQVITKETIDFMRKLDVKEIHGYQAALGLELIKPEKLGASRRRNASEVDGLLVDHSQRTRRLTHDPQQLTQPS